MTTHTGGLTPSNFVYVHLKNPINDSPDMNVDGTTPVVFEHRVPENFREVLFSANIVITDADIDGGKFGGLAKLGNGLTIALHDANGEEILDITNGQPIMTNEDWTVFTGTNTVKTPGSTIDLLTLTWDFVGNAGEGVRLDSDCSIRIAVRDDLQGLSHFRIMLHGQLFKAS